MIEIHGSSSNRAYLVKDHHRSPRITRGKDHQDQGSPEVVVAKESPVDNVQEDETETKRIWMKSENSTKHSWRLEQKERNRESEFG